MSSGVGSQSFFFASNSACVIGWPSGLVGHAGPDADVAAEARRRQLQLEGNAGAL
jgi:hypothetical protein